MYDDCTRITGFTCILNGVIMMQLDYDTVIAHTNIQYMFPGHESHWGRDNRSGMCDIQTDF